MAEDILQPVLNGKVRRWVDMGDGTHAPVVSMASDSVSISTQAFGAVVSLTRTADTNAYLAGDVIGAATGSTAALTFAIAPASGGEIMITSATLETDASAVIGGEAGYRLYLYNVTPPSALGDNAPFDLPAGDRNAYLGHIDLGQPVDLGSTCRISADGINKQVTALSGNIFAYLVTLGAFTDASATVRRIGLHSVVP